MSEALIFRIAFAIYLAIGFYSFFWIKRDAEFRTGTWVPVAILSIILWPAMNLMWMLIRGKEHLSDLAAKQSHRDYQIYMRGKKDKDLFAHSAKASIQVTGNRQPADATTTTDLNTTNNDPGFKDFNIEGLMGNGQWDEALAVAKEMHKVCIQSQDESRAFLYEEYMRRIEEGQRSELD